jgi:hypothetical protein
MHHSLSFYWLDVGLACFLWHHIISPMKKSPIKRYSQLGPAVLAADL